MKLGSATVTVLFTLTHLALPASANEGGPFREPGPRTVTRPSGPILETEPKDGSGYDGERSGSEGSYDGSDDVRLFREGGLESWLNTSRLWQSLSPSEKTAILNETLAKLAITSAVVGSSIYVVARNLVQSRATAVALGPIGALLAMTSTANADETLEYHLTEAGVDRFYSSYGLAKNTLALPSLRKGLARFHNELAQQISSRQP